MVSPVRFIAERLGASGHAAYASAMIAGAGVILFDPIFQGVAISLRAGEVASLLLSRTAVPVLCYVAKRREHAEALSARPQ